MALLLALLLAAAAADVAVSGDLARFSPDVIKAADFAISAQNRMSNYPYAYKVMSVLSDTAQIYPPARVKYSMVVEVGETACKNTQSLKLSDCVLQNLPNTKTMTCSFVVLAVPRSTFPAPSYLLSNQCN